MMLPIVLLHGAGCDGREFDELAPRLAPLDVIRPDLPGRGDASGPAPTTVADAATFVARHVESIGVRRAVVLGHSYGGAIALELALARPDLVAGLVLVATGAKLRVHPSILATMEAAAAAGPRSVVAVPWLANADPAVVARFERHAAEVPSASTLADWRAAHAFDRMAEVANVSCPTLVLAGTADPLTPPKYARFLAERIAGAELALVEGAGHMLPVEHAAEAAARIVPFAARIDARPR